MLKLKDLNRKNFHHTDFWYSKTAEKHKITNVPTQAALVCLMRLADTLQFIRDAKDIPLIITSGYRCYQLNRLVKGSPNSAHMQGLAADILFKDKTPEQTCDLILETGVKFDQMLIEENILHFGIKIRDQDCRHEIAYARFDGKNWIKTPKLK